MNNKNDLIDIITARTPAEPISQAELAEVLGIRHTRSIRLAVHRLRQAGVPILSTTSPTCGGYFTGDGVALNEFLDGFKRRAIGTLKTLKAMRRGIPDEQMSFDDLQDDEK